MEIYVDADACPVKDEVFRVAGRYGFKVYLVSNTGIRIPKDVLAEMVLVKDHFDAADDWITENIHDNDIAVSADILLASRCLKNGARVIDPKGRVFTKETIGDALANRELSAYLRDMGNNTSGPVPFGKQDRSRFLQHLDGLIQAVLRGK
jgi:uncharacterized protein YaiI (UPF0178 family)